MIRQTRIPPPIAGFKGDYRWLSNFHRCTIPYEGIIYPSVEHAYQAAKTLDINSRQKIQLAPSPGAAKRMGRNVLVRQDWVGVRLGIMLTLLREKFKHELYATLLRNTGEAPLVEENVWHDNYWGSCTCPKCGNRGGNWLGILLMQVREEIR